MANKYLSELVLLTKTRILQDLKDWLHWHLDIIGFDHIHVFDNESDVDIKLLCESYGNRVSYEVVKGWANQYSLYNRYINNESHAWWVFQCDDDEFLYVSDKFENKINEFLIDLYHEHHEWNKLCVGWRNLFPEHYAKTRTNPHLVLNATGYSHNACKHWQYGDTPIKTFVRRVGTYDWTVQGRGHNPVGCGNSYTLNEELITSNIQKAPTKGTEDLILFHYQFKSDDEWRWKCKNRKSPSNKAFFKNFPEHYKRIYNAKDIKVDDRAVKLWREYEV